MWRPFAKELVTHAYENFSKQSQKGKTSKSLSTISVEKADLDNLFPHKCNTQDIEDRKKKFEELQEKVEKQRALIKHNDELLKKKKKQEFASKQLELAKEYHEKRKEALKIREFAQNKIRRKRKSLGANFRKEIADNCDIFELTVPKKEFPKRRSPRLSLPAVKTRPSVSVKAYQDKMLEKLSEKAPSTVKYAKKEFESIRSAIETSFDNYLESRKIKRRPSIVAKTLKK